MSQESSTPHRASCCINFTAQHLLAFATFFSAWGDRMWTFAVGLFLVQLTPGSLRLTAVYGLVFTSVAILFTPVVGSWIDRNPRLKVIRYSLILQNLMIFIDAIIIYITFQYHFKSESILILVYFLIIIFGAFSNIFGQGQKISIEKDWIVVSCKGDKVLLSKSNALLRGIDLTVNIAAPIAVGLVIFSKLASVILICIWNVLSLICEYYILLVVYKKVPELSTKKDCSSTASNKSRTSISNENSAEEVIITKSESGTSLRSFLDQISSGWKIYVKQSVSLAGLSLAMLYLTVLGFNSITFGYAYDQGLSGLTISIFNGFGAFFGVLGAILFPFIRSKLGTLKTGSLGFFIQCSMLMICVAAIWAPGSPSTLYPTSWNKKNQTNFGNNSTNSPIRKTASNNDIESYISIIMIMVGIVLSRSGLWISDLSITQLQQEYVPESERGRVGAVQYALNEILDLCHFILTISLPLPRQFGYLTLVSVGAILTGGIIYQIFRSRFKGKREEYQNIDND